MNVLFRSSLFLALISTALGGINSIVFKQLIEVVSFQKIALYETCFLLCFFGICKGWSLKSLTTKSIIYLCLGSFLQALAFLFFFLSLVYLTPLEFSFLSRNQATLSIIIGFYILNETYSLKNWFSMGLLLLGAVIFTFSPVSINNNLGIIYALLFCISLSLRGLVIKKSNPIPVNIIMFWGAVFSFLIILPIFLGSRSSVFSLDDVFELDIFLIVSLSSLFSNAIGTALYFKALERGNLSTIASIRATSPLFVAVYSFFFFEYSWTTLKLTGLIICVFSLLIFLIPDKSRTKLIRS